MIILLWPAYLQAETITMSMLTGNLKSFSTLSGSFRQENLDIIQDRKMSASGSFFYLKPGLMKWEYLQPDPYSIIVGSKRIWIYDPILESVTIHDARKVKGLNALAPIFEPDRLHNHFIIIKTARNYLDIKPGDRAAYLAYKQPDPNISELQIAFDAAFQVRQFVILDKNGNYRKITFDHLNPNPALNNTDFDFQVPEGVEIIDKTRKTH